MLIADEVMSGFGRTDEWFAVNHWNAVPDMITMAEGITSGYLLGEELAFVKTFSFFPGNPTRFGCPTTSSVVLLFDASMGLPICLMEGDWVTVLKTGTSTAVTAACLAPPDTAIVTIFGAGTLGRMHLRALTRRFDLRHAHTVDIVPQAAEAYVAKLQPEMDFAIEPIPPHERERILRYAQVKWDVGFTCFRDDVVPVLGFCLCYFLTQHDGVLDLTEVRAAVATTGVVAFKGTAVVRPRDVLDLIQCPSRIVVRVPMRHLLDGGVTVHAEFSYRQSIKPPDFR